MPDASKPTAGPAATPLIVDLGKHARKQVRRLREGRGKLLDDVTTCLEELKAAGKIDGSAQPVVIIVRQRRRKNALWPV